LSKKTFYLGARFGDVHVVIFAQNKVEGIGDQRIVIDDE